MMKRAVIVYASKHHGNTFKLIKAIFDKYEIAIIDAMKETHVDLQEYDMNVLIFMRNYSYSSLVKSRLVMFYMASTEKHHLLFQG